MKKAPDTAISRFAHFARAVWGLSGDNDTVLAEVGIDSSRFAEMAEHAVASNNLGYAWIPLEVQDVLEILNMCL